jgi:hypothetical protein
MSYAINCELYASFCQPLLHSDHVSNTDHPITVRPTVDAYAPLRLGVAFKRDVVPLAEQHLEWRVINLAGVLIGVGYLREWGWH